MPSFENFEQLSREFQRIAANLPRTTEIAMRDIGERAEVRAKSKIGEYQKSYSTPGGHTFIEWAPLTDATLYGGVSPSGHRYEGKIDLGYSPPDNPLLREGDLRASLGFTLRGEGRFHSMTLGSTSPVMVFMEWGTRYMVPRQVVAPALAETVFEYGRHRLIQAIEEAFVI